MDVGGLVASTMEIKIDDFINDDFSSKDPKTVVKLLMKAGFLPLLEAMLPCWLQMSKFRNCNGPKGTGLWPLVSV